jgi:hypothetical protein
MHGTLRPESTGRMLGMQPTGTVIHPSCATETSAKLWTVTLNRRYTSDDR